MARSIQDTSDSRPPLVLRTDNVELVVKAVDGCVVNERLWVFASSLTDVEVLITVADTETGRIRRYFHRQGKPFQPVQDIDAFACE